MRGWLRYLVFGLPPIVILILVCLMALPFCASCGDHDEAVTELVRRCKRATMLLGDDPHPARMGVACGSTEVSGGNGHASWSTPYTGSRARGTVSYDAIKRGGNWSVDRASLEVGDETIDLIACTAGAAPSPPPSGGGGGARLSQTNADAFEGTVAGTVIRGTHPTIATGTECMGTLRRERGSPTAHVVVTCGTAPLYDGHGSITLDVRDATRRDDDRLEFDDSQPRGSDGPPRCRLSAADGTGTLTVWSTAPVWELVVEL
jgi:Cytochrome oxidase complex assembly protein 1